jgi:putative tryptophan/tyrosine transport system substrate-binding protein
MALIGGASVWPSSVKTQPRRTGDVPTIGFLVQGSEQGTLHLTEAFQSGLENFGYVEGKNIRVFSRFANGDPARLATSTKELVDLGAVLIVTAGATAVKAANSAAPTVPIVHWASANPVWMGWDCAGQRDLIRSPHRH